MKEIWKEYKGNYAISNLGNIKNTKTNKILKLRKSHNGYFKTNISIGGKIETIFIHRLVAEAFIPNPHNLPQVNHKDECKTNNCVDNLRRSWIWTGARRSMRNTTSGRPSQTITATT